MFKSASETPPPRRSSAVDIACRGVRGDAAVRANPAVFGGAARAARRDGGGQLTASIRLRYAKWLAHQRSRESAASEITGGAPSQPFDLSVLRAVFAASDALDRPRSADLLALGRLPGCHVRSLDTAAAAAA